MRTNKLTLLAFAVIAALATSCNNDELTSSDTPTEGTVITATAGTPAGGADTRLTHADGSTKMDIVWAADDAFTAYHPIMSTKGDFNIKTADAGKAVASFTTTTNFGNMSTTLYALYPANVADNPSIIPLTLEGQTGALTDLKNFNYMTASAQYTFPSFNELAFGTFAHQVAIVKLVLTFPDDVTATEATEVGLKATGLNKSTVLNLTTGVFSSSTAGDVTTGTNPVTITDKQLTAYLCVFGGALTDAKAVATVGSDNYEAALSDLTIVAGNMYTATVSMTKKAVADYIEVNGIKVAVGNLVANGANSCKIGAPEDGGLYFQFGSLIGWAGGANGDGKGVPASNSPIYDFTTTGTVVPFGNIPSAWDDPNKWSGGTTSTDVVPAANDPCTHYLGAGWRLPTQGEYAELFKNQTTLSSTSSPWKAEGTFVANNASYAVHTSGLLFPASGYRFYYGGILDGVGTGGNYWSGSPNDDNFGYSLYFDSSLVSPSNDLRRAYGLPVRCVQSK